MPPLPSDSLAYDVDYDETGGQPAPAPYITNSGVVVLAERAPRHTFVSRAGGSVDLVANAYTPEVRAVVYLDYKSEEIVSIEASYTVEAIMGPTGYTNLNYSQFQYMDSAAVLETR